MYSKFPFSMENIPRQRSFVCLSLRFGCILSGLILILYSVLSLAQCTAALGDLSPSLDWDDVESMITFGLVITVTIIHAVTLFLSALMLVGTLREKGHLLRPWMVWTSVQVLVYLLLFVFWSTMTVVSRAGGSLLLYVLEFLCLLIRFYMLMLVASYYKQLEEEQFEGERLKTLVSNDVWYNTA